MWVERRVGDLDSQLAGCSEKKLVVLDMMLVDLLEGKREQRMMTMYEKNKTSKLTAKGKRNKDAYLRDIWSAVCLVEKMVG